MDRHREKKTTLLVDNLRRCGGVESILIFHKLTQEERACSYMLSLLRHLKDCRRPPELLQKMSFTSAYSDWVNLQVLFYICKSLLAED